MRCSRATLSSEADIWQSLFQLATASGPPGYESGVAEHIAKLWRPFTDEINFDALGNVIAHRMPTRHAADQAPAIMLATHMDEIALMVTKVEESGFLRVAPLGGVDLRIVNGKEVVIHGRSPLHGVVGSLLDRFRRESEHNKAPTWDEVFIDAGVGGSNINNMVEVGDLVTFAPPCIRLQKGRVAGKAFDNRASVAAVHAALQLLANRTHTVHVHAVATVQEEVGVRGATVSAFSIAPQAAIAVDVGFGAMPGIDEQDTLVLGKGPGITLGANIHKGMRDRLLQVAKDENIPWQMEVAPGSSGTDAWALQVAQSGIPTAVISLPLRYMHSPVECADLADLHSTARLLAAFLAALEPAEVWGWANGSF